MRTAPTIMASRKTDYCGLPSCVLAAVLAVVASLVVQQMPVDGYNLPLSMRRCNFPLHASNGNHLLPIQSQHRPCSQRQRTATFTFQRRRSNHWSGSLVLLHMSDDWSNFDYDKDDDEIVLNGKVLDRQDYAVEGDSPETKAAVGMERKAPSIERDATPIQVVAGSQLELTEDTVLGVLAACRGELGTLFGYTAENRGVGITGGVDYVDLDGPTVIVKLKGRFWHTRSTVLERVANYLQQRIPEIVEVQIEDEWQLTDEANDIW